MAVMTNRWRGAIGLALAASATAFVAGRPKLLLVAVLGVAFAAYSRVAKTPEPDIHVERQLSDTNLRPGDEVTVTVTVTNEKGVLPDARIVDGVPPSLAVTSGSPRVGGVLWPGRSISFTYRVMAKHGRHSFESTTVVARNLSGAQEVKTQVTVDDEIDCTSGANRPLRDQVFDDTKSVIADQDASDIDFSRAYDGSLSSKIENVNRSSASRTDELPTAERSSDDTSATVLLVDARSNAYRTAGKGPHAVEYGLSAAEQLFHSLHHEGGQVGLAAVGCKSCWLTPDIEQNYQAKIRQLLATQPSFNSILADSVGQLYDSECAGLDAQIEQLCGQLSDGTHVVLLSPLLDDNIVDAVCALNTNSHYVSVVSVDVMGDNSIGQRLAAIERRSRISRLRSAGLPVVEWQTDMPLVATLLDQSQEAESI